MAVILIREDKRTDIAPNRHVYVDITGPNECVDGVNEIASDQPGDYRETGDISTDTSYRYKQGEKDGAGKGDAREVGAHTC